MRRRDSIRPTYDTAAEKEARSADAKAKDFVGRTNLWSRNMIRSEGEILLVAATIKF